MKYNNVKKYGILRQSVIIFIIFGSIVLSINAASAVDRTYYWNPSSGVIDSSGFTANWGNCNAQPTSYRITVLSIVGFTCNSDRLTTISAGDQFLAIYPVAYSTNTLINGKTGATFYLSSQKNGYTAKYRFDLGYAHGGTFTSLGNVTQNVSSRNGQIYTIDMSRISGTAPAGSYPALKVSVTSSQGGRIYLGTNGGTTGSNSGRFYVNETVAPALKYNVTIRASPTSAVIPQGGNITYNITVNNTGNTNGDYTLTVSDSDSVNFVTPSVLGRTSIFVPTGGSNTTTLKVTSNSSAAEGASDTTTVTATSVQNPSYTNSTQVQTTIPMPPPPAKYNVTISASPTSASITAGNSYIYNIIVNNTGNTNGNYTLSSTDSDIVNFISSTLGITTMQINSGSSAMTTLNVTARTSATTGAIDNTTVSVVSVEDPAYNNSAEVQTTVVTEPPQGPNCLACHAGAE